MLRAVVVDIAGEPYAFPHNRIDRVIRVARDELRSLENRQYFEVDGQNVGIVMARQVLQLEGPEPAGEDLLVVLFSERSARYGLVVDGLLGEQDLVVRPLDRRLGKVPNLHAAAILDDGSPVLIVDPDDLRRSIEKLLQGSRLQRAGAARPSRRNAGGNASSWSTTRSRCGKSSGNSLRTRDIWSRSPWTGWKAGTWCARGGSTW